MRMVKWSSLGMGIMLMLFPRVGASWTAELLSEWSISGPWRVGVLGDINGDGRDDLYRVNPYNDTLLVYYGGIPLDTTPDLVLSCPLPVRVFGDFNADGFQDIFCASTASSGSGYIFFGGPSPDDGVDVTVVRAAYANTVGVGDFNGDGVDDLISVSYSNSTPPVETFKVIYGGSLPSAIISADTILTLNAFRVPEYTTFVDLDGDGRADEVSWNSHARGNYSNEGVVWVRLSRDGYQYIEMWGGGGGAGLSVAAIGDLNGDGIRELVLKYNRGGSLWGRVVTPSLRMVEDSIPLPGYISFANALVLDLNGDGVEEILSRGRWLGRYTTLMLTRWVPGESFQGEEIAYVPRVTNPDGVLTQGDIDGDGTPEIVDGPSGTVSIFSIYLYRLLAPVPGEVGPVGALRSVQWKGRDRADLYLSVDGGNTWTRLAENLGGSMETPNVYTFRVPHTPSRYALVRLVQHGAPPEAVYHAVTVDSFFVIDASVSLLNVQVRVKDGRRVVLEWTTHPGPEDLQGYIVYRLESSGNRTQITPSPLTVPRFEEPLSPGTRAYLLTALNGWGQEIHLGEIPLATEPLQAVEVQRGRISVSFFVPRLDPSGASSVRLALYTPLGRRVHTLYEGTLSDGIYTHTYNIPSLPRGVYFLRLDVDGVYRKAIRLPLVR